MNLKNSYEAKDIEVLEGLEPVRKRPGMYIGGTDDKAIHHLALEILDNSMDEAIAGHADLIKISLLEHNTLQIEDNGRGIPIDDHPKFPGKSALEIIVSTLHAGGKFSNGAYETSGGLHGVGVSVVNALSENLEVTVIRSKKIYSQKYSRGIVKSNLEYIEKTTKKSGTIVKFTPDPQIFGTNFSFSSDKLFKECQSKAYLLSGVKIVWTCKKELVKNEQTLTNEIFCYPNGIIDFLNGRISSDFLLNKIHFTGEVKLKEKNNSNLNGSINWVCNWSLNHTQFFRSYCNLIHTSDGGTHETGFWNAILKGVKSYGELVGNKKVAQIIKEDISSHLCGIVSLFISNPTFSGQTKDKLTNVDLYEELRTKIVSALEIYFDKNVEHAQCIIQRVFEAYLSRVAGSEASERSALQSTPVIATPEVYKSQFGERSKNWHDFLQLFFSQQQRTYTKSVSKT